MVVTTLELALSIFVHKLLPFAMLTFQRAVAHTLNLPDL